MMANDTELSPRSYLRVLRSAYTKQYTEHTDEWTNDPAMRCVPALVQGQLRLPRSARALDIGCGSGSDVEYLSWIIDSVVGIDIFPHSAWDRIIDERRPRVAFTVSDFLSYQCADGYDMVLDNGCFHHQHEQDHPAYLRKVATMLLPGGCFVLSTFKNPALDQYVDANGRLHKYFTDDELQERLGIAGLEVVRELDIYRVTKHDYYRLSFCGRQSEASWPGWQDRRE